MRLEDGGRVGLLVVAVGLAALSSCSVLIDTAAVQCSTDGDCRARGPAFAQTQCVNKLCRVPTPAGGAGASGASGAADVGGAGGTGGEATDPIWGCLGHVTKLKPAKTTLHTLLTYEDTLSHKPLENATVLVCSPQDLNCSAPLDRGATDPQGSVAFDIPTGTLDGFSGFFRISYANYIPLLHVANPPIVSDTQLSTGMITPNTAASLAQFAGTTFDATLGLAFLEVHDCQRNTASNVTFSLGDAAITPKTKTFYLRNTLPSPDAVVTDESGLGGLINVNPGFAAITAKRQATGDTIGSVNVVMQASSLTYVSIVPQ